MALGIFGDLTKLKSAANGLPYTSQVALGIFGALTKLKSAAYGLPYTSLVALGLSGQCNAQASKVAHFDLPGLFSCFPNTLRTF